MSSQITRRQHYVWKYHLKAWEVNGKIAVLRKDGTSFATNPINAAVEKDFYRLPRLERADFIFLCNFIKSLPISDDAKIVARGWIRPVFKAYSIRKTLSSKGRLTPEVEQIIDDYEIQADENYHAAIEDQSLPLLDALRHGNAKFWHDDEQCAMQFAYFIALQHMRTKRMADRLAADQNGIVAQEDFKRRWPILRHILATNVGSGLFVQRASWRLRIIEAPDEVDFITADQPVMNLLPGATDNDMALYYPVSPRRALLIEHEDNSSVAPNSNAIGADLAKALNFRIFDYALEQVFSNDLTRLRGLHSLGVKPSEI